MCKYVMFPFATGQAFMNPDNDANLRKALLESDGAICRSGVKITADSLKDNHRLRAIARAERSRPPLDANYTCKECQPQCDIELPPNV